MNILRDCLALSQNGRATCITDMKNKIKKLLKGESVLHVNRLEWTFHIWREWNKQFRCMWCVLQVKKKKFFFSFSTSSLAFYYYFFFLYSLNTIQWNYIQYQYINRFIRRFIWQKQKKNIQFKDDSFILSQFPLH